MDIIKILAFREQGKNRAFVYGLPGDDESLTPEQMRNIALALITAAEMCDAHQTGIKKFEY